MCAGITCAGKINQAKHTPLLRRNIHLQPGGRFDGSLASGRHTSACSGKLRKIHCRYLRFVEQSLRLVPRQQDRAAIERDFACGLIGAGYRPQTEVEMECKLVPGLPVAANVQIGASRSMSGSALKVCLHPGVGGPGRDPQLQRPLGVTAFRDPHPL